MGNLTLKTKSHLHFELLEVIRHCSLCFTAHLLAGPLEGAVELLANIHDEGLVCTL